MDFSAKTLRKCDLSDMYFQFALDACVGVVPFIVLAFKFYYCKTRGKLEERRSWKVFAYDAVKLLCGVAWLHFLNTHLEGFLIDRHARCSEYCLYLIVDTTLGSCLICLLVFVARRGLGGFRFADFGYYKGEDGVMLKSILFGQVVCWLVVVSIMRFVMIGVVILAKKPSLFGTGLLLVEVKNYELVVARVLIPILFNTFQACCLDEAIKDKATWSERQKHASRIANATNAEVFRSNVRSVFEFMDRDLSGRITSIEFKTVCMKIPEVAKLFDCPIGGTDRVRQRKIQIIFIDSIKKNRYGASGFQEMLQFCEERWKKAIQDEQDLGAQYFEDLESSIAAIQASQQVPQSESSEQVQLPSLDRRRLPEWLPKWAYNEKVAKFYTSFESNESRPALEPALHPNNRNPCAPQVEQPLLPESSEYDGPPQRHCVGPAIPFAWCATVLNFCATAFMPAAAFATMTCKGDGFADHATPIEYVLDGGGMLVFVTLQLYLQWKITTYTILGQLGRTKQLKLFGFNFCDCGRTGYVLWLSLMSLFTAFNLLNVWTNAEVLGRVLTTFQSCSDAKERISDRWEDVLRTSSFQSIMPDFLTGSMVLYAFVLLQPFFVFLYTATWDNAVDYEVGDDENYKHENYQTPLQQNANAGADHNGVVQVLSAGVSFEAVNFQEAECIERTMEFNRKLVEQLNMKLVEQLSGQQQKDCAKFLVEAIDTYLRSWQLELQKGFLVRLICIGFFQNAFQTKVQITMLSINYNLTGEIDPLFLLGVVGNIGGYFFSILELGDLWKMYKIYFQHKDEVILTALQNRSLFLSYADYDCISHRQTRVWLNFWGGIVFAIIYIVLFLYQVLNFVMVFKCDSHVWNFSLHPYSGCYVESWTHFNSIALV